MSVIDTLYRGTLVQRAHQQRWDQPCRTTVLVCLPPAAARSPHAAHQEAVARLTGHAHTATATLDRHHFPVWCAPRRLEQPLLIGAWTHPRLPGVACCAGGPIGLLDLHTTAERSLTLAADTYDTWSAAVASTPAAEAWWNFLDRHHGDPDEYPLSSALTEFSAQPRIAAMLHHDDTVTDPVLRFGPDCYGPGLTALHGGASRYADHLTGVLTAGGGLLTLDRELIVPSFTDVLVEQSLPERAAYHQTTRAYVRAADPNTVLVAVTCHR